MSDVVTINGKEYKIGDVVKSEYYSKDECNDLVLNGFTVKVGDTWLTRDKKKIKINAVNNSAWPIVGDSYSATYSVLGIRKSDYSISKNDLETKFVEDECTEPVDGEPTKEELIPAKKKKDSEDIEELPDLDIEIGDVWLTAANNKVEIIEYNKTGFGNESPFVWRADNGDSYTAKGKYFSSQPSSKDLVTRVSRVIKIRTDYDNTDFTEDYDNTDFTEDCDNAEFTEDTSAVSKPIPSECTDMGLPSASNVEESDATISYAIIDTANCECNFDYEFENTLKRLVAILYDKIKERALNRDLAAVKDLTKKLEKVIALETL